jgi:rsbT co-antagonist protein RsbR
MSAPDITAAQAALARRLDALELTTLPIWVFDDTRMCFLWANRAALELWRSPDRAELLARDLSDASRATRTRSARYRAEFAEGRTVWDVWTMYPKGRPTTVRCHFSPIDVGEGRSALLVEGHAVEGGDDPAMLRGVEALRHTSIMVALLDEQGQILMLNPATIRAFREAPFATWFADPGEPAAILAAVAHGEEHRADVLARTASGDRWHRLGARRALDPATGAPACLVEQSDITARREDELTIARQHEEILALSAPLLAIGRDVLAAPIIGVLDAERGARLMERLLAAIVERQARHVVIDLTGAGTLEAESAESLLRLTRAIRLLGAQPLLTGIQPSLAQAFVDAGGELPAALVFRDPHQALVACGAARA